jgi:hypothetical protein
MTDADETVRKEAARSAMRLFAKDDKLIGELLAGMRSSPNAVREGILSGLRYVPKSDTTMACLLDVLARENDTGVLLAAMTPETVPLHVGQADFPEVLKAMDRIYGSSGSDVCKAAVIANLCEMAVFYGSREAETRLQQVALTEPNKDLRAAAEKASEILKSDSPVKAKLRALGSDIDWAKLGLPAEYR